MDAASILNLYAQGLFPMDEPDADTLPWWTADPRTLFALDRASVASTRRAVRRSLAVAAGTDPPWELRLNQAFDEVIECCGRPRSPGDGVWLTDRMHTLYRTLHAVGHCQTFEVWTGDGRLAAGLVAVTLGRAAMLESMFHRISHAGNALLVWTLEALADAGYELCDVQLATSHTRRLGAVEVPRAEYELRLRVALRGDHEA